jgi:hypothetical protein
MEWKKGNGKKEKGERRIGKIENGKRRKGKMKKKGKCTL